MLSSERIIEKRKVQALWLKGVTKDEYQQFLLNELFLESQIGLASQLRDNSTQKQQIASKIQTLSKIRQTTEQMKQSKFISQTYSEKDHELFRPNPSQLFEMEKIGKKGGGIVKRQFQLQADSQMFQIKNSSSKSPIIRPLEYPEKFFLQTFDQFHGQLSSSRIREMGWTKSESSKVARLVLSQTGREKGIAVYFDQLEQAVNVRDSLICVRSQKQFPQSKNLLKKLSTLFNSQFRQILSNVVIQTEAQKIKLLQNNKLLKQLDGSVVKCFWNLGSMVSQFKRAQFIHAQELEVLKIKQLQEQEQINIEQNSVLKAVQTDERDEQENMMILQQQQNQQQNGANSNRNFTSMHSISDITSHQSLSPNQGGRTPVASDLKQPRKQLWLLSQNEQLQTLDKEILRTFADQWKKQAYKRKVEKELSKKMMTLSFFEIELEVKMDLIKPILVLSLTKQSDGPELRMINEQSVSSNQDGVYFTCELQCKVKNRVNQNIISWAIHSSQLQKMNPSIQREQCEIRIQNFEANDTLTIELKDQGFSQAQLKAKGVFILSELCKEGSSYQRNWLGLDLRNSSLSQETKLPFINLDSFVSPITQNVQQKFEDILQTTVDLNLPSIDPIYGEQILFPTLTKKQIKILQKTLEKNGILTNKVKFLLFDDQHAIKTLRAIKKNGILLFIKQISLDNSRLKKNFDLLVLLQEALLRAREPSTQTNTPISHQIQQDEREDPSTVTLGKLLSERKTWKQKCPEAISLLNDMCKEGIPNCLRMQIWRSLSRVSELKSISERSYSQFRSIRNYYSHNQMTLKGVDDETHLSLYEHLLRNSMESYVVLQQQIHDDIRGYIETIGDRSVHCLNFEQIENILNAFVSWSVIIGADSNSPHFAYLSYAPELIYLIDKISLFYLSQAENSEGEIIEGEEEEIFWELSSIVYFVLKGYYRFNPNSNHEGIRSSLKMKEYMPVMFPPLQTNKLAGIKAELLLLKILIKENIPEIAVKLNDIGLPIEHYFSHHLLTMFSRLFNPDTVFRLWDIILYESSLENEGHTNILMLSVLIALLAQAKEDILKCKGPLDVEVVLKVHGTFITNSGDFIRQVLENKKKFVDKMAFYLNILLNLEDELKVHYNSQCLTNLKTSYYVTAKNEFDKCDPVQIGEVSKIVQKLKERDNKQKFSKNKADSDDSLEIPDQFDDDNEREMYQLADNKFLSHLNKNLQEGTNVVPSAFIPNPGIGSLNLTQNNFNQLSMNNLGFNIDLFNQEEFQNHQQNLWQQQLTIFRRPPLKRVLLYLHKLKLFWAESTEIVMEVSYEQQTHQDIKIIVDTCIFLNHSENFLYVEGADYISIRLYEDPKTLTATDQPSQKRLIKQTIIDFNNYPPDTLLKTTLSLKDNYQDQPILHNYTTSEIDISLLLLSDRANYTLAIPFPLARIQAATGLQSSPSKLLNYLFKIDDKSFSTDYNTLRSLFRQLASKLPDLVAVSNFSLDPSQKLSFRLNSETTFETMRIFLKVALNEGTVSGLSNVNFIKIIFDHFVANNQNKTFYFSDFMIAVILFAQSTFNQKMSLCFDLLQVFDSTKDREELVSLNTVLEFVKMLYDSFMIFIPNNQIYDMVEYAFQGSLNGVLKAQLTVRDNPSIVFDVTKEIIAIQNSNSLQGKCKDISLGTSDNLMVLKTILDEKIKNQIEGQNNSQLILNIKYRVEGQLTKFTCLIDKDWKITKRIILDKRPDLPYNRPDDSHPAEQMMHNNENLLSLTSQNTKICKSSFIRIISKLPLLRYFVNFQNTITQAVNTSSTLNHDQFTLPSRKILISSIQATFSIMLGNQTYMVITAFDDRQKRIQPTQRQSLVQNSLPQLRQRQSDSPSLQTPTQGNRQTKEIQTPLNFEQKNAALASELRQKRMNVANNNQRSSHIRSQNYEDGSNIVNSKLNVSFFEPFSQTILQIQNALLQETINQLDMGQSNLVEIDIEKTSLDVYVQNQYFGNLSQQSIFDIVLLQSNQNLNFKLVYSYNKPDRELKTEASDTPMYSMDKEFNQLGKFWFSEFLSDWRPCLIEQKRTSSKRGEISYFLVRFKHDPLSIYLKKPIEVLMVTKIDVNELQENQETHREGGAIE